MTRKNTHNRNKKKEIEKLPKQQILMRSKSQNIYTEIHTKHNAIYVFLPFITIFFNHINHASNYGWGCVKTSN